MARHEAEGNRLLEKIAWVLILAAPAVGSFAALLADRIAEGRDWVRAPSVCDGCGRRLTVFELVPILSWLLLGGRARCCGTPIRARLVAAEVAALVLVLWAAFVVPPALLLPSAGLAWTLLALALIDLRVRRLPDPGTLGLVAAGLCFALAGQLGAPLTHLLGAVLGYCALAGVAAAYRAWRGIDALGLGDAKLFAAAGAWLGPEALPSVVLIGAGVGLLQAGLMSLGGRRLAANTAVPFGPGLALGFWVCWLHGPLQLG